MFFTTRRTGRTIPWRTDWEIYTLKVSELQAETEFWSLGFVFWGTVDQSFTLRRNVLAIGLELELRREGQNFGESCYFSNWPLVKWHTLHLMLSFRVRNVISLLINIYIYISVQLSSVQSLSRVQLLATPWTAACQASLSITNSKSPPKPMSIKSVMPSNHLILCHPLLLLSSIFRTSRSYSLSWFFASDGQSIGVSASTSVLPMNTQDWSLLGWTGWISLQSKGLPRVFSNITVQKHQFFCAQLSL